MTAEIDEILADTLRWLAPHRKRALGDHQPMDVFNRLLAKGIAGATKYSRVDIAPHQVKSSRESWSVVDLAAIRRHGELAGPRTVFDGPIIVVEYRGAPSILDGNHRVNTWRQRPDAGEHLVHLHVVDGVGSLVELPPVR